MSSHSLTTLLLGLVPHLEDANASDAGLEALLGTAVDAPAGGKKITPHSDQLEQARLFYNPQTGALRRINLRIADTCDLPLKVLADTFGPYRQTNTANIELDAITARFSLSEGRLTLLARCREFPDLLVFQDELSAESLVGEIDIQHR